ncbi:MAG TPA: hypothetical protein VFI53_05120 [Myxococcaceae bacterium]|nr:hypothetical protein [Myxococcaceae bacterium]
MHSRSTGGTSSVERLLLAPGFGLVLLTLLFVVLVLAAGCSAGPRPFSTAAPVWRDDDRHPFKPKPDASFVPLYWDGADHIFFRPVSHAFLLQTPHEAMNVNALDEVPDSSWFTNRIGQHEMTVDEIVRGACRGPEPHDDRPWKVVGVKIDGANPGFQIKTPSGRVYVLKFDDPEQWERASTADVVGSRLYYAAGFHVPCNRVVFLRPEHLVLPEEEIKDPGGRTLTAARIDELLKGLPRESDGTIRTLASRFLPGKPLGPWEYSGRWGDDRNDVIDHEDRRELRGSRILGAWLNHHDARSQNTLAMWIDDGEGRGHVEHDILDWGDTLGGLMQWDSLSRRVGYTYYIDFGAIGADFATFGFVQRPWERAKFGPAGKIWGYFDDAEFVPEDWHVGYPNVAFSAMQESDGAWMARIISHFDDAAIEAIVNEAHLSSPVARSELIRILKGRRDRIVQRYLLRLSSLERPTVEDGRILVRLTSLGLPIPGGGHVVCVEDRAEGAGLGAAPEPSARLWFSSTTAGVLPVSRRGDARLCIAIPDLGNEQRVLDVSTGRPGQGPLRIHLLGGESPRVVGLERPADDGPPPG